MEDRFELRPRQGDLPVFRRMTLSKLLHLFSGFYTVHEVMWSDSDEEREGPLESLCTYSRGWQLLPF